MSEHAPRVTLTRLPADEAAHLNVLVGTGRAFAFTWAGQPAQLRFTAAAEAAQPTGHLRLRLGEHAVDLGYLALPEPAQLGTEFAGLEAAGLPDELRLGVLETLLEEPLALLRRGGVALRAEGWQPGAGLAPARLGWEIHRGGQGFLAGTLHLDDPALAALAALAARAEPAPRQSGDAIPVTLGVAAAHVSVPVRQLAGLAPGDVLLPGLSRRDWESGRCTLWAGAVRIGEAVRQEGKVQILAMKPATAAPPAPAAAASLKVDDLPVQLVFDVGQLEITLGQLRTLGAGFTFELPAVPARLVTIRANTREVGVGELVDLGDKVGVRIVNWSLA